MFIWTIFSFVVSHELSFKAAVSILKVERLMLSFQALEMNELKIIDAYGAKLFTFFDNFFRGWQIKVLLHVVTVVQQREK